MDNVKWIFNGIGTEILVSAISMVVGGTIGYRIGIKRNIKQKQRAGDNVNQVQIGDVNNGEQ